VANFNDPLLSFGLPPQAAPLPPGADISTILQSMTPEQLQQLLAGASLDSRSALVKQQLANAQGPLNAPQMATGHSTLGGAIGGGIGDIANALRGSMGQSQAMAGMQSNIDAENMANKALVEALRAGSPSAQSLMPAQMRGNAAAEQLAQLGDLRSLLAGPFGGFGGF